MIFKKLVFIIVLGGYAFCSYGQDTIFNQLNDAGQKTGYWKKYYDNGKLRYEGCFENDKPVGLMRKFYKGGIPEAVIHFSNDGNSARAELFYENGKIAAKGNYVGNKKDSTWLFYSFYNGRLAIQENYTMGKKNGMSQNFYDNGQVSEKTEWKNGIKDGLWEQYYENGQLRMRSSHKNGERDGEFETYSAAGKPSIQGYYKDGVMNGPWQYFKEDGEPDFTAQYVNGKMLPNKEYEKRQDEFSRKIEEKIGEIPDSTNLDLH